MNKNTYILIMAVVIGTFMSLNNLISGDESAFIFFLVFDALLMSFVIRTHRLYLCESDREKEGISKGLMAGAILGMGFLIIGLFPSTRSIFQGDMYAIPSWIFTIYLGVASLMSPIIDYVFEKKKSSSLINRFGRSIMYHAILCIAYWCLLFTVNLFFMVLLWG